MMLTDWFYEVDRRVDGRALTARFGETHGRKIRGRIASGRSISQDYIARLVPHFIRSAPPSLGLSKEDTAGLINVVRNGQSSSGPLSAFVAGLGHAQAADGDWIKRVGLASHADRFDTLSERLRSPMAAKNIKAARALLAGSDHLSDNDWLCPSHDVDMRVELDRAETWEEVKTVIARLQHNSVMSFMSLWDIAYSNAVFPRFRAAPTFLLLAPRLRPNVQEVLNDNSADMRMALHRKSPRPRDIIDLPFSLLFDVVSALLLYDKDQNFPRNPVSLKGMVSLFDFKGIVGSCGDEAKKLDRLRSGRDRTTVSTFIGLLPDKERNGKLVPLLYAAHAWTLKLLPRSTPSERKVMIPDAAYRRCWNTHRTALQARGVTLEGGAIPWPEYLARREIRF